MSRLQVEGCRLILRPFPVDILVRTPQEVTAESEYENSFIKNIVTEGKVLYERREQRAYT